MVGTANSGTLLVHQHLHLVFFWLMPNKSPERLVPPPACLQDSMDAPSILRHLPVFLHPRKW
jgi:hypothetical protein